jgi:hypothetical protein
LYLLLERRLNSREVVTRAFGEGVAAAPGSRLPRQSSAMTYRP